MLQRIQTIFYLLAAVAFGILFKFPFATSNEAIPDYMSDKVYNIQDHPIMMGLAVAGIIVAFIALIVFKNRGLQLKLGNLAITLGVLVPLVAFALLYTEKTALMSEKEINDQFGLYIPVFAILFAALANRFVKKDDKLVKSMDRLR